ncbi:hypothetical protein Tco_1038051, partial [Tanacetum coccineum]
VIRTLVSKGAGSDTYAGKKQRNLSRVSRDDSGSKRSGKDSVSADTDYDKENMVSDNEGNNSLHLVNDLFFLERILDLLLLKLSFQMNCLQPLLKTKNKEKLTEVVQQPKKFEAAERRRMQNEKAARTSLDCSTLLQQPCVSSSSVSARRNKGIGVHAKNVNVGSGKEVPIKELIELVKEVVGFEGELCLGLFKSPWNSKEAYG